MSRHGLVFGIIFAMVALFLGGYFVGQSNAPEKIVTKDVVKIQTIEVQVDKTKTQTRVVKITEPSGRTVETTETLRQNNISSQLETDQLHTSEKIIESWPRWGLGVVGVMQSISIPSIGPVVSYRPTRFLTLSGAFVPAFHQGQLSASINF